MTSRKLTDQQIRHCIAVLDALAQSGQGVMAFAQAQGMSYAQLRGWQAHGARWRAQQAAQRPCEPPVQSPMEEPIAKPALACDFIQARVVPLHTTPAHCGAADAHTNAHAAAYAGGTGAKLTSVATTKTQSLPRPTVQSSLPQYQHDPPNPAPVQIICIQGQRSAIVNWPSSAPLECAQWLRAYLT